jgi:hypothetical protein
LLKISLPYPGAFISTIGPLERTYRQQREQEEQEGNTEEMEREERERERTKQGGVCLPLIGWLFFLDILCCSFYA